MFSILIWLEGYVLIGFIYLFLQSICLISVEKLLFYFTSFAINPINLIEIFAKLFFNEVYKLTLVCKGAWIKYSWKAIINLLIPTYVKLLFIENLFVSKGH